MTFSLSGHGIQLGQTSTLTEEMKLKPEGLRFNKGLFDASLFLEQNSF